MILSVALPPSLWGLIMLNKIYDTWIKRYIPLSILRDSESLVIVASEWGSTLPQLLLCPSGKWACENQEEKLQANNRPRQCFRTWPFPCFRNSYLSTEGEERGLSSSLWMLNGKGQSPFLPRSSMEVSTSQQFLQWQQLQKMGKHCPKPP